jgi:hypothetical protein
LGAKAIRFTRSCRTTTNDRFLPFAFPAVASKKITAAFDGGRITSDGGVMVLAQAERRLAIAEKLALARRLAVIMHRIWVDGTEFRWTREVAAA